MVIEGERDATIAVYNILMILGFGLAAATIVVARSLGVGSGEPDFRVLVPLTFAYALGLNLVLQATDPRFWSLVSRLARRGKLRRPGGQPAMVEPEPRRHMDKALWALFLRDTLGSAAAYMDGGLRAVAVIAVGEEADGLAVRAEVLGDHPALLIGTKLLAENLEKGRLGFSKKFVLRKDAQTLFKALERGSRPHEGF